MPVHIVRAADARRGLVSATAAGLCLLGLISGNRRIRCVALLATRQLWMGLSGRPVEANAESASLPSASRSSSWGGLLEGRGHAEIEPASPCLRSIRAAAIGAAWFGSQFGSLSAPVVTTQMALRSSRPASNPGRDLESHQRKSARFRIRAPATTRPSARNKDRRYRQRSPGQDRRYRVRFG